MLLTPKTQLKKKVTKGNWVSMIAIRGKWTSEALDKTVDVIERKTCFLQESNRSWNTSLSNQLNGKIKSKKMDIGKVSIEEEDAIVIAYTLPMQECGLFISLGQLKTKVARLTLIRLTPFQNGILGNN